MSSLLQVRCINKSNRTNPYERITHIGGINPNGTHWRLTQEKAISDIENDIWKFYVSVNGQSVRVIVSISSNGNKYLKTENDGEQPNNLLSLPECP